MNQITEQMASFKSFMTKLLLFVAVIFVMDRVAGVALKHYYFTQQGGFDYLSTETIDKATADIMIFGSSRAVNLFDTRILSNETGMSSYIAGRYGEPLFYHWAVLKSILKRHKPKLIILSFDAGNLNSSDVSYDRLSVLLPYYADHPEVREIVAKRSRFEKLKLWSASYPYNSLVLPIISGNRLSSTIKYANFNGYIPLKDTIKGPLDTFDYTLPDELSTEKILAFTSFIKTCHQADIPLLVTCPPYMINANGVDRSITRGKAIAAEMGVPFLDFTQNSFYTSNRSLFADYRHLNEAGVKYFVQDVLKTLKDQHFAGLQ